MPSPTPSPPSPQAIATLEGEAGVALIERTRSGAWPTTAGAALARHASGILAQIEAAESEVAAIASGHGGHLRVASFPTAGATLMPGAVTAFRASHPGVELTLAEDEPEEIAPRLRAGEFDLVLLFEFPGFGERLGAGMRRFDLLDDPLHLALPHDHRLAGRSRLRLEDLAEDSWSRPQPPAPAPGTSSAPATRPASTPASPSKATITRPSKAWSRPGSASPLIPQLALSTVRPDILVRPLDPQTPVRKVFAATPDSAAATPAVATMLDVLREAGRRAARAARPNPKRNRPHRDAACDDVAFELLLLALVAEAHARPFGVEVFNGERLSFEKERQSARDSRRDEIFDDFRLAVDEDRAAVGELVQRHVMALVAELEVDAAVDDAFAVHALADAGGSQQIDGSLLEHAGADTCLDVLAGAALEDDGLDAFVLEEARERKSRRTRAEDADLRSRRLHVAWSSSSTCCAIAKARVGGGHAAVDRAAAAAPP